MKVEVWSDIVCPWCYIGRRRFQSALSRFGQAERVAVIWRSFELDPQAERQFDGSLDEMLASKYGVGRERARQMNEQVTQLAGAEGLDYRLDVARPGNTFDAHRLLHFAGSVGLRCELEERFLRGYFTEGKSIGDHEVLTELAVAVGLERERVEEVVAGDEFSAQVRADEERARVLGVDGVPFFFLDGRYGISGAQPTELFLEALTRAWDDREEAASTARTDRSQSESTA